MATGVYETTSDEILNFRCTPCAGLNRAREAVKYCVECQGYVCQSCIDMHRVIPALKGHNLKDKSSLKSTVLITELPVVPTETCDIHEIKIMDMYCGDHDVVGCTSCMALDHRSCTDVHLIPEVIDTVYKKTDADEIYQKVQDMKTQMEKLKGNREALIGELKKSKAKVVNEIKKFRKEMENILIKLEKESIKEVEKLCNQMESTLQQDIQRADSVLSSMKKAADDLVKSEGNKAQQFVSVKTAQRKLKQSKETSCSYLSSAATISFGPDSSVKKFLQQLQTLGSVSHSDVTPLKPRTSVYTIKSARELNIRMQSDASKCCVYGSCLTEDNALLIADCTNKKLKRVDIVKMSAVDQCDLPNPPYSVCQTSKQEAAISLNNSTIQFVSLGNQMNLTRKIKLNHGCFGIAYKTDRLYITDNDKSLYIHDMTGNLLGTVARDSSRKSVFHFPRHIAFNETGDEVFVAGWDKGLITLDGQGRHISSFTDTELSYASAVCTDRRGNIFVSGYNSNNVIQIGNNGKKMGVIVKSSEGLNRPESMCFYQKECALIVTEESSDIVKFFYLQ